MSVYRCVVLLGTLLVSTSFLTVNAALAADDPLGVKLPKELTEADFKQFCPKLDAPPLMPLLARAIVTSYNIPVTLLDWNDDVVVDKDEFRLAVSTSLCPKIPKDAPAKCVGTNEQVAATQASISRTINERLVWAVENKGQEFNFLFKDGRLNIKYNGNEKASAFILRDNSKIKPGESKATMPERFFASEPNSYFTMKCIAKWDPGSTNEPPAPPPPDAPVPLSPADAKISRDVILDQIRLRGSTADLYISRDKDSDFKNASSASIAIVNDNEAHKNTFDGHMALGYAFPPKDVGEATVRSIPYLKMDRTYTSGTGSPKTAPNVDNVGFGLQENVMFPVDGIYGNLAVQPDYTYSLRSEAKVGKMQLSYEAYPPLPAFGKTTPIGWMGLSAFFNARALLNIGRVFTPGTDTSLTSSTFTQGGVALSATLSSDDSTSPFNGFSVPVTYTYLYGFVGDYKAIQQLTVAVNYALTKFVSVKASQTSGRNVDTFEKQSLYKLSLGFKY